MHQKGLANIVLVIVIVLLVGAVGYFAFIKKSEPVSETNNTASTQTDAESEVLAKLKIDWQSAQTLIPFRPSYHNQAEDAKGVWRSPNAAQFIGENNILVRFEDDNNTHVAVFGFGDNGFSLLEIFKNQGEFTLSGWQNLVSKHGDASYSVSTYTTGLVKDGQIVGFPELTKVSENIFVENYWENTSPSNLESQIQLAVNQALAGPEITGYQPIPKGSKLLSTKVVIGNNIATITLNFNGAIIANGQAAFEDTLSLVSNTIHPIVQGQDKDPKYAELQFVILIEGRPLNEVLL